MSNSNILRDVNSWAGVWTALITPFEKEGTLLKIDQKSLERLIEFQISNGVRGLVIAGSTGEGSLLSPENYIELLTSSHRIANRRIPLVAGLGIGGTESTLKNLEIAKKIGFQGVLASPPAYIKAPQRGLKEHFLKLGACKIPVCLYEIAGRAASSIEVSTLAELGADKSEAASYLIAIKDASANLQRALDTKRYTGNRFAMLSGDDGTYVSFLGAGGNGVISVVSHLTPKSLIKILSLVKAGKTPEAVIEQLRITPLIEALFWESNPVPVKSLAHRLKMIDHPFISEPLCQFSLDKLEKLFSLSNTTGDNS